MELTGAQAVVQTLRALGTRYVFNLPGTGIMQILDALVDAPEVRPITTRHEQIAAHMADGYARVTGEPGVVMVSRGPGAMNVLSATVSAWPACSPMVVIAGQVPTAWQGREAFEEYDIVSMFRPTTKYAFEVERVQTIPEVLRRAFKEATTGRPGPVMISVPFDLLHHSADFAIHEGRYRAPVRLRPPADRVEQAAELLLSARRPVVFAGGGVRVSGAYSELEELARLLGVPVVPTSETDVLPTSSPVMVPKEGLDLVREADVLFAIGCRFTEFATEAWTLIPNGVRLIQLDIDPFQIEKIYPVEVGLIGDARAGLQDLLVTLKERLRVHRPADFEGRRDRLVTARCRFETERWPADDPTDARVRPWQLVRGLRAVLADDAILVEDCASLGPWFERCWDFRTPGTHIRDVGGTMGFGFAAAAGIKLAMPERQVACFVGDGAFMMVDAVINTMQLERLGVLTVVWNNQAFLTTGYRYPRVPGNYLQNPNLAEIAEMLGAAAERVERVADLRPALERGLQQTVSGKPAVVEILTDADPQFANPGVYFGRRGAYRHGTPPPPEAYYETPIRS